MEKTTKNLFCLYILVVLIKIFLSYFISSPTGFWDEFIYAKLARSFFLSQTFTLSQNPAPFYPPLYSIIVSISYLANNMEIVYLLMKIINAFLSSLIIIPAYLLSKEFLEEKYRIYYVILIILLPINFSFSYYILAENIFSTLFLASIYFIYKSLKENTLKNNVLASIFISLAMLTKNLGLILIPIFYLSLIIKRIILKEKFNLRNIIISLIIILIFISPWLIRNYLAFGPSLAGLFEESAKDNLESIINQDKHQGLYFFSLFNWIILHIVALILGSGVILFFSSFLSLKNIRQNRKLFCLAIVTIISVALYVLVLSNNALGQPDESLPKIFKYYTGRPIFRYVDMLSPLILLLGIVGLINYKIEQKNLLKKIVLISIPFFIISSQLTLSTLFPINNLSLTHIGAVKTIVNYFLNNEIVFEPVFNITLFIIMLLLFSVIPFFALLINKLNLNKIIFLVLISFIIINSLNFIVAYHKSQEFLDYSHIQLGLWFNEFDNKTSNILFEYEGKEDPFVNSSAVFLRLKEKQYQTQYVSLMGFWMNDNLFYDSKDLNKMDYLITNKELNFLLINNFGDLKVYKLRA